MSTIITGVCQTFVIFPFFLLEIFFELDLRDILFFHIVLFRGRIGSLAGAGDSPHSAAFDGRRLANSSFSMKSQFTESKGQQEMTTRTTCCVPVPLQNRKHIIDKTLHNLQCESD